MQSPATTTAPLVPALTDLFNKRVKHNAADLQPGDSLHLTTAVLGFPKGRKVPVYGYCVQFDAQGFAYSVTAYVRPDGLNEHAVAYTDREARRYPVANQREQWFGSVLMYLTEIDLTDYADCLRLERLSQRVLPLLESTPSYCQAA